MPLAGRHVPIELDEIFRCRCGAEKAGDVVGKRGGRQWKWRMPGGVHEYCTYDCAKLHEQLDAERESNLAEYEAEQAMQAHGESNAA